MLPQKFKMNEKVYYSQLNIYGIVRQIEVTWWQNKPENLYGLEQELFARDLLWVAEKDLEKVDNDR